HLRRPQPLRRQGRPPRGQLRRVRRPRSLRADHPWAVMSRPKILMVEDSEDNLRILAWRLRKLGDFDLREARDGLEAVAAVEADPPDLIFMDLGLPRMDGWEATRRIRELPGGSQVRIVAFTGHTTPAEHQRAIDVGCDDFIAKPVVKSEVIGQALRRWLPGIL